MRVVLDTNVLVLRFDLVMPLAQLEEIGRVLAYPKIRRILHWDDATIGSFLRHLYLRAEIVEPAKLHASVRDPDDLHILAALAAGKADILVTGDGDLLGLRERYSIETPAELVRRL